MKKIIFVSTLTLGSLSLAAIAGINSFKNAAKESKAYSVSSLPTTIYLNDSTSTEIRNYYSGPSGFSAYAGGLRCPPAPRLRRARARRPQRQS